MFFSQNSNESLKVPTDEFSEEESDKVFHKVTPNELMRKFHLGTKEITVNYLFNRFEIFREDEEWKKLLDDIEKGNVRAGESKKPWSDFEKKLQELIDRIQAAFQMNGLPPKYCKREYIRNEILDLIILKQLALTMQKIHDSGFLYCDFSPENIFLLKASMTAVFIDFGSALEKIGDCVETEEFIPSSYGYRAPEVEFRNHPGSEKSALYESGDVFAFMTVFYRLVSEKSFAWTEEFSRALSPNDRIISWKRMKEIGIENPAEGVILNRMLLEGLQWDLDGRISNVRELLKYVGQLEQLMHKKGNPEQRT